MMLSRQLFLSKPSQPSKKKNRGLRRQPSFESLELRTLLSSQGPGLGIGINLTGEEPYTSAYMWANVVEQSNDVWYPAKIPASGFPASPYTLPSGVTMPAFDSNGYPIGLGDLPANGYGLFTTVFVHAWAPYPTGTYTLTFQGSGTVKILNGNQPAQVFSQSESSGTPFNVNILSSSLGIVIAITSSDPSNYVSDISLVMPGLQISSQTNPFNPQFLSTLAPFSTIRFMGLMLPDIGSATTSNGQSGPLTWADRTVPTYFTQCTPSGMSVEYMVQLCNLVNENMWVAMPVNADSQYVANFAQYVEQNLNPNLKVYIEYGNEVWNTIFPYQHNYVNLYATSNNESFEDATADLTTACWDIWSQVFAGQTNRMVRVVASQFVNPALLTQELNQLIATANPTDPDHGFDVVSVAPYFSTNTSSFNAGTTDSQIESDLMADLNGPWKQAMQSFMATVATFEAQLGRPIPVDMYEGGVSISAPLDASWWNAYVALQTNSGMLRVITTYLDDLSEMGVQGLNYLTLTETPSQFGEFGAIDYVGEPSSLTPKYNALVEFTSLGSSGLPTATTAGTPLQLTITVYSPSGSTIDTGFTGTIQFASSEPGALLPASYTFTAADQGVHTFTVTLKTAGTQSISVTDSSDGLVISQSGIVVQPAAARSLVITGLPSTVYSGLSNSFEVAVEDPYGNVVPTYTGTVHFTSSDPNANLPLNYTFTSAAAGIHFFSAIFNTYSSQTLAAADTVTPAIRGTASTTVEPMVAQRDTTTEGNWIGVYGSQGYDLPASGSSIPSYAAVTVSGASLYTWGASTTDPRGLQTAGGSSRIASCWYSPTSFTVDVNLTDGQLHSLDLYLVDWDSRGRSEQVQLASATTGAVLDTETVSSFTGGVYLKWLISGNVLITITRVAGVNALLSGLFLGPPPASASFVGKDTTTEGNWMGTYGSEGYDIAAYGISVPSYATVITTSGASLYTWVADTTDPRGLQTAGGASRIATCWYSYTSFSVDVNLTDGQPHTLVLYFVDWDARDRSEQVQVTNASTGQVLSTETLSSFQGGVYLVWQVSGNVMIKISHLGGVNAVLSGVFVGPAT